MKFISCVLLAVTLLAVSCNADYSEKEIASIKQVPVTEIKDESNPGMFATDSAGIADPPSPPQIDDRKPSPQTTTQKIINTDWDKKIIKTGVLNAEVKDYAAFYNSIREKIKSVGGYVAQENQTQTDYKIENTLSIKIPVDQFDNAIVLLGTGTEKVNERRVTSQDVSTEMVDTKSRMEAKKQVRDRYMDLLKNAKNMTEVLQVEQEVNGIQEQIESAAGRLNYMGHATAFSTIDYTIYQVLDATVKDQPKETQPSFGDRLGSALRSGWSWVSDIFLGLVSVWPLLILGFLVYAVVKKNRTRMIAK